MRDTVAGRTPVGLLDFEGAAAVLGCTPRMIRKLVEDRKIASVKIGRLVRFEPVELERFIEANRRPAVQ